MLQANDFVLMQAQASIFTPGMNFQTNRVLAQLLAQYADQFNGEPVTIPVPEGFPLAAETPRFILQSRDGSLRLQAAPSRLDVVRAGDTLNTTDPLPAFLDWCLGLFDTYLAVTTGRVGRVAAVVQRKASPERPARAVAEHFCQQYLLDGPLNRPSDFEVHAAKQFDLYEGLRINSWFRCKTAVLLPTRQTIVQIEQDFNSLPEETETREFGQQERRRFFGSLPDGFQQVMALYFPQRR